MEHQFMSKDNLVPTEIWRKKDDHPIWYQGTNWNLENNEWDHPFGTWY